MSYSCKMNNDSIPSFATCSTWTSKFYDVKERTGCEEESRIVATECFQWCIISGFYFGLVAIMNSVLQKYFEQLFYGQLTCISIDILNLFFSVCNSTEKNENIPNCMYTRRDEKRPENNRTFHKIGHKKMFNDQQGKN